MHTRLRFVTHVTIKCVVQATKIRNKFLFANTCIDTISPASLEHFRNVCFCKFVHF